MKALLSHKVNFEVNQEFYAELEKMWKLTYTQRETTNLEEEKSSADFGNIFQNTLGQNFHRLSEPRL